jgi:hypothetical protein
MLVVGLVLCSGCSDDGDDDSGAGGGGSSGGATGSNGGGGAGGAGADVCERGCVVTLAASCDNGPTSQGQCVNDCQTLMSGSCGTQYRALQACADGQAITCSAQGLPVVQACATEQDSFVACLN